jgi:murein DD-endopeptidase MepM/ murein hydrolase activator NlpD
LAVTAPADTTAKGIDLGTSQLGKSYQTNQHVSTPWLPNGAILTQGFGVFETAFGINAPHMGIDLAGKTGDPIVLPQGAHAQVEEAGWDPFGAGNFVKLLLDDGSTVQLFHMQSISVSKGQDISGGTLLGHMDSTGDSTGPHTHFQVDNPGGIAVDPWSVIQGAFTSTGQGGGIGGSLNPLDAVKNINDFFGHLVSPGHDPCSPPSEEVGVIRIIDAVSCPQNWWKVLFTGAGVVIILVGVVIYFFKEEKEATVKVVSELPVAAEAAA